MLKLNKPETTVFLEWVIKQNDEGTSFWPPMEYKSSAGEDRKRKELGEETGHVKRMWPFMFAPDEGS